jgi:hypothetical protein
MPGDPVWSKARKRQNHENFVLHITSKKDHTSGSCTLVSFREKALQHFTLGSVTIYLGRCFLKRLQYIPVNGKRTSP